MESYGLFSVVNLLIRINYHSNQLRYVLSYLRGICNEAVGWKEANEVNEYQCMQTKLNYRMGLCKSSGDRFSSQMNQLIDWDCKQFNHLQVITWLIWTLHVSSQQNSFDTQHKPYHVFSFAFILLSNSSHSC